MTTNALPFVRRRPARDPEDDVETGVFTRRHLSPTCPTVVRWDREMVLQMTHDLAIPPAPARAVVRAPSRAATIARRDVARPNAARPSVATPSVATPSVAAPNVFLTPRTPGDPVPPWEISIRREASPAVLTRSPARARTPVRRRSMLPWFLFAMSFGIAFGVANDTALRAELMTSLRGLSAPAAAALEAGARAAHRVVAAERASAPRPIP